MVKKVVRLLLQVPVFDDVPDATLLNCLLCKEFRGFEAWEPLSQAHPFL